MRIDKPIIFSGPMVRALLDGRKTQTRRLAFRSDKKNVFGGPWPTQWGRFYYDCWQAAGERDIWLWVREKHWAVERLGGGIGIPYLIYDDEWDGGLPDEKAPLRPCGLDFGPHPSIHMFRWASRLSLEVTGIKIERLQDISDGDCRAEGHRRGPDHYPQEVHDDAARDWFMDLWNSIHGPGAWEKNPEVVVLTFRVHRRNIDDIEAGERIIREARM